MNTLRSTIRQRKNVITSLALFTSACTPLTLLNKSYNDVSLCQGAVGSGGGAGGDNENQDILSKIKIAMTKNVDFDTLGTNIGNKLNQVIATGVPTEISYGFVCGFSSGLALKKFGKVASIVLGLGFAALQTLSYAGYIQIDHVQLQKDVERAMDLNKDGKVDAKDMGQMVDKVLEVLQFGIPGGAGFVTGFIGGFRSG